MKKYPPYQHVHFIGIGGIGMSGIAEVLLNLGYQVSGSDVRESETTRRLASLGAHIFVGHHPSHIYGADVIVYSSAIGADNPEIREARHFPYIPVIPRAEMLAEIMRMKHSILVAGAHGKTTTTSMIGTVLVSGGFDPTVVIGGRLRAWGSNTKMGTGEFFVAEADESDGSFLLLSPTLAVVTNVDREHLDYYRDLDHITETFVQFLNKLPFYGVAILCLDDPIPWKGHSSPEGVMRTKVLPRLKRRFITYGFSEDADIRAEGLSQSGFTTSYRVVVHGTTVTKVSLQVPGVHNVLNSLAAFGVGHELGMSYDEVAKGLERFTGVERRFHVRGERNGITVVDDYGHHPREIQAVLHTMAQCFPRRRKIVVFQPHRYTRTHALMEEFSTCFFFFNDTATTEIYTASEKPIPGVSGETLAHRVERHCRAAVHYIPEMEDLVEQVSATLRPGDVLLTLGEGSVWTLGERVLRMLREDSTIANMEEGW